MVKIGPFLTKINEKTDLIILVLIEMKITDQLVNKNVNFVINGSTS